VLQVQSAAAISRRSRPCMMASRACDTCAQYYNEHLMHIAYYQAIELVEQYIYKLFHLIPTSLRSILLALSLLSSLSI
jgi:hypothetical protein